MSRPFPAFSWLQVFRTMAHCGSIQQTAEVTGQSVSTVSHQLRQLEAYLGVPLIEHGRRPMVLTPAGLQYLRVAEDVLKRLDEGKAAATSTQPHQLHALRLAIIDDFEADIAPEMTRLIASALPQCKLTQLTRPSHDILSLLRKNEIDIGIATRPQSPLAEVTELPVLRDPFVIAVPADSDVSAEAVISGQSDLPFLRYNRQQFIGGLVEAQLTRLRIKLDNGFELDSTSSIMALIAQSGGWAITTPGNYARSKRFQAQVRLLAFPRKSFARTISVFAASPQVDDVAQSIAIALRHLSSTHVIGPMIAAYPWLEDSFRVLDRTNDGS